MTKRVKDIRVETKSYIRAIIEYRSVIESESSF